MVKMVYKGFIICLCVIAITMAAALAAPTPAQAVDQVAVNNAVGKILFLPFRPMVMGAMYLSKFVTGLSKGNVKEAGRALCLVAASPVNLPAATIGDLATVTKKKSPYGPTPYKPVGKEFIVPPF